MTTVIGAILLLTTPAAPAQQALASNAVHVYGDDEAERTSLPAQALVLPDNITVAAAYQDLVDAMLRQSPTFRAQCARIAAAPHLRVDVQRSLLAPTHAAITQLTRQNGRLEAQVAVSPFGDPILLIAHEFEHVVEQLDDVDLPAMAVRPGTGVYADPLSGGFETERAIAVGKRVERELSRAAVRR